MVTLWFRNGEVCTIAARLFQENDAENRLPDSRTVKNAVNRFLEFGNVDEKKRPGRPKVETTPEKTVDTVASTHVAPKLSLRERALEAGSSKDSIHRIMKEQKIRPFKTKIVQKLQPGDPARRLAFCEWALEQIRRDPNFGRRIIFTDESSFVRHGQVSRHWTYHWGRENPHETVESRDQYVEKLNVWCAIWDDTIIGPFFIEGNLNAESCRELFDTQVWPQLEPLIAANADLNPIFMLDGAPAHTSRLVTDWLYEHFGQFWMGNNGPTQWPPRSPDLTPLDFFLWGYLKNVVYPAVTIEELRASIEHNVRAISGETLRSLQDSWKEKLELCVANQGGHFEQYC